MIKKIKILLVIFAAIIAPVFPQRVELDFPKLGGDTAWIYLFTGSGVDSIAAPPPPLTPPKGGNASARGSVREVVGIPQGYRGIAYLYIPEKGGGEFILAEENVRIRCEEEQFHGGMLEFPNSDENAFLRWGFQWRNNLVQRQEWLKAGELLMNEAEDVQAHRLQIGASDAQAHRLQIGASDAQAHRLQIGASDAQAEASYVLFNEMVKANELEINQLDSIIKNVTLYSARFMELIQYMQRLYAAVQSMDATQQRMLKDEMENTLDINALYHSGNLWTDVHSYYPGLFYGADGDSAQTAYARSILATMRRLEEPVLTAFLSTALTACERTNRQKAQEVMLTGFIMTYPTLPISDTKVQRMLGALSLNKGAEAPQITGLEKPLAQPAIVIFFDSDCDHCRDEIDWLSEHYNELTDKGYRIISIAADTREINYRNYAVTMPWDNADRLCDFKGTDGENFKNYGVIGTPTIFVIDGNGTITGKYAQMKELKIENR